MINIPIQVLLSQLSFLLRKFLHMILLDQLVLKSLEAFGKAADGKATKIIIPSEIQGIAGLAASLKEIMVEEGK